MYVIIDRYKLKTLEHYIYKNQIDIIEDVCEDMPVCSDHILRDIRVGMCFCFWEWLSGR